MAKTTIKKLDDKELEQVAGGHLAGNEFFGAEAGVCGPAPTDIGGPQGEEFGGTTVDDLGI